MGPDYEEEEEEAEDLTEADAVIGDPPIVNEAIDFLNNNPKMVVQVFDMYFEGG